MCISSFRKKVWWAFGSVDDNKTLSSRTFLVSGGHCIGLLSNLHGDGLCVEELSTYRNSESKKKEKEKKSLQLREVV